MRVTDHGGGVWSIPVPIPDNPLGHTLVYVLETDRGPVLIDTGWDDPASYELLERGLNEVGTRISEIHGVVITHHHPDHHGLSGKVREASGAWVAMHPADIAVVRRMRDIPPQAWPARMLRRMEEAGAPEEHLAVLRMARDSGLVTTFPGTDSAIPDREIVPNELLDLAGRRLRAIWTPGHSPGHVCLHLEEAIEGDERGRLFSGDHLLPEITPHIGLWEEPDDDTDPLGDYLDSLERIARLDPAEVLPAHQHSFRGAENRIQEILVHHEQRLENLRRLITDTPRTVWQLAEGMEWNRPWEQIPFFSRNIAVSEAAAHLRRLVKAGLAEPVPDTEPVRYRAV